MRIEAAVREVIESLAAVVAIVDGRIRVDDVEQGLDLPYLIIYCDAEEIIGGNEPDFDGRASLWDASVRIESRAATRSASRQLDEAVRLNATDPGTGLHGWTGSTATGSIGSSVHTARATTSPETLPGEAAGNYSTESLYRIQFQQTEHGHS